MEEIYFVKFPNTLSSKHNVNVKTGKSYRLKFVSFVHICRSCLLKMHIVPKNCTSQDIQVRCRCVFCILCMIFTRFSCAESHTPQDHFIGVWWCAMALVTSKDKAWTSCWSSFFKVLKWEMRLLQWSCGKLLNVLMLYCSLFVKTLCSIR